MILYCAFPSSWSTGFHLDGPSLNWRQSIAYMVIAPRSWDQIRSCWNRSFGKNQVPFQYHVKRKQANQTRQKAYSERQRKRKRLLQHQRYNQLSDIWVLLDEGVIAMDKLREKDGLNHKH
jgi:hypothetical protein